MKPQASLHSVRVIALLFSAFSLLSNFTFAGSATWNLNPTSGDWNTATNWAPATVPDGPSDTATFASSNRLSIGLSAPTEIYALVFQPGGGAFTITTPLANIFTLSGAGIVNNSGVTQHFVADQDEFSLSGGFQFSNHATAGSNTEFTLIGGAPFYGSGGQVFFNDSASADHASFDLQGAEEDGVSGSSVWFSDTSTAEEASFLVSAGKGYRGNLVFTGSATAANASIVVDGGSLDVAMSANLGNAAITSNAGILDQGQTYISASASADHATLILNGATFDGEVVPYTQFQDQATAGNATIICNGGTADGAGGASVAFTYGTPTAANATIIANGGSNGGSGGFVGFGPYSIGTPSAANATLITNGGSTGGTGGTISFAQTSDGGAARVEVFDDGTLDISSHAGPGVTIGSLKGNGLVLIGANNLTIGSNNVSTRFDGVIQDGGSATGGSLTKVGTGRLILTNANTYTGGTTVNGGTLLANYTTGSGLGTGPVLAVSGILGGSGIISGRVTMGTGRGTGTTLGPGANSFVPGTLTIRKQLALKSDATYRVTINSTTPAADLVIANGVRIIGAQIVFNEVGSAALPPGTVFTVISNTSNKPISGTFSNLPEGGSITVGNNTFQASYTGGDRNDLTITVLP
jgi:autotransporter-associated beta strand protein